MSEIERLASQGTAVNLVAAASRPFHSENLYALTIASLLDDVTIPPTVAYFIFAGSSCTSLTISNIIVQVIWALYRENRVVLSIATFFYVGGAATLIGLTIHDYVGEEVLVDRTLRNLPGCYASSVPSIIAGFWIGPLIVESVLFVLVVSRAFFWWRHETRIPVLLAVLARDSTLYFALVFALLLANYLVFQFGPPALSSLLVTPTITAGCILGSHMLLNVRAMNTLESEPPRHDIIDLTSWPRFNPTQTVLCGSDTSHGQDYIGKHRYGS
ncbi:hypothetical protein CC1G_11032 [Coprinopsis cinerea okayama7|uniref:Uncharacterized protein n=1 Tax=Coprinopsis cinerea (strain Okayama-7 / 130 / ATCC MYA-4618 / FGSC 9003) TaxID=240176 RepID=A8NIS5_COPC7|nr:hypothetical protein CC1G_11032 [Coprinopsis cinerea okayama7\|eukprot:XP_001834062.2 hypothetical protein CC1G_11032 [Coprinopsis cinerea okayama7\